MSNKPKVFISSTIYDFRDLRSALKYYLESLGYEVLLSEYNDFKKDLNKNSFESCLKTIEEVQFFILLVGGRVGGFYDKVRNVSITQMEYRKAYEELKKGKLKIVNIVRENLWDAKNERKALKDIIESEFKNKYNISDEDVDKIRYYESDVVRDTEFVFNFLNEIARVREMKEAQKDSKDFPIGNWIHPFKTHRDIIDILKREFSFSDDLESIAMKENIKFEIIENLMILLNKSEKGTIYQNSIFADDLLEMYKGDLKGYSTFNEEQLKGFQIYLITGFSTSKNLKTDFTETALKSGKFLSFDNQSGKFTQSSFSIALQNYKKFIDNLKYLISVDTLNSKKIFEILDDIKVNHKYTFANIFLFGIASINNLQKQIIDLSYALYLDINIPSTLLDNYNYDAYPVNKAISDEIKAKSITEGDILRYLGDMLEKAKNK